MYRKPWTNTDLINDMVRRNYRGYEVKAKFESVMVYGIWHTVVFISDDKGDNRILYTHRICRKNCFEFVVDNDYDHVPMEVGNAFYKQLKATKRTSKNNCFYYREPDIRRNGNALHDWNFQKREAELEAQGCGWDWVING